MDELNQLEMFMEQLGPKKRPEAEAKDEKENSKGKRRPEKEERKACLKISNATLKKMKLLALWLDEQGCQKRPTLMSIMDEAVDYLIEGRYPKAKRFTER